jgi:hypothetical protein
MAKKMNNKPWEKISTDAQLYFDKHADWMNHFAKDVIEEAQEYYAYGLEDNEYGRLSAVESAWDYAQGASRFMQKPTNTTEG